MKNNKMKKALLVIGLGLGIGLSGAASADKQSHCDRLWDLCEQGYRTPCLNYNNHC